MRVIALLEKACTREVVAQARQIVSFDVTDHAWSSSTHFRISDWKAIN